MVFGRFPEKFSLGIFFSPSKPNTIRLTDIDTVIDLTRHEDARVRQLAIKEMCPCRVRGDIEAFYRRLLSPQLVEDPAVNVRQQVLHDLCDGSPAHLEQDIAQVLEVFNRDPDSKIRRTAHKVMASYHRTGKWNIL